MKDLVEQILQQRNKEMEADFKTFQDETTKDIWDEICQIITNIAYSSVMAEHKTKKQGKCYARIFCLILALPSIKTLLLATSLFKCESKWLLIVDVLYVIIPIIAAMTFAEFVLQYLGFYEKDISALIVLNGRLENYKRRLLYLYSKTLCCTSVEGIDCIYNEYLLLSSDHDVDKMEHEKLIGKINPKLENEAKSKAEQFLKGLK